MTTTEPTARIDEAHEHFQRRRDIVDLQKEVDSTEKLQYTEEDLNAIQIRTYRMVSGKDSEPTFKPCFFMPYKGELSEDPYNEQLEPSRWKRQQYRKKCFLHPFEWVQDMARYFDDYSSAQFVEFGKGNSPLGSIFRYEFPTTIPSQGLYVKEDITPSSMNGMLFLLPVVKFRYASHSL
ncbi:uncharacterized protein ASPGLDRAFT_57064 [Aspergillus glaucus CBS 516.65]|uniref:Uncharacterized protein n=1 Tax=Aspergillus glaucus CBS 516.65 TaxID=1160497 RepID=A0A1L9VPA2_ASPGL|nr:hypothetical protein ASPGLDRAFT_57064 [Aspergillus glaucus CBS 516.65]OJJ85711.1 hypothetical protein ASPGLDRAFT_57064 [Aspergillus glaucus CBS 516.65]